MKDVGCFFFGPHLDLHQQANPQITLAVLPILFSIRTHSLPPQSCMSGSCECCLIPLTFQFSFDLKPSLFLLHKPICFSLNSKNNSSELQICHVHLHRAEQVSRGLPCGLLPQLHSKLGDKLESRNGQIKSTSGCSMPFPSLCTDLHAVRQDAQGDSPSMMYSLSLTMLCFIQVSVTVMIQPELCGL